jgi:hypothetical protein
MGREGEGDKGERWVERETNLAGESIEYYVR